MKVKVKSNNITINTTNKYKVIVNGISCRIRINKEVRKRKVTITRIEKVGGQVKYKTEEQRYNAIKKSKRKSYNKKQEQYKKDINKNLSGLDKQSIVQAEKNFIANHYEFNYLITLQTGFKLDKRDEKICKTSKQYEALRQQNKYQVARCYNEQQCYNNALSYIKRLTKNGEQIYDNYYIAIHKSHYDNTYHAHIIINIIDTTIKNVHTYLQNRWYRSKRKKQMVKKIYNVQEILGYINEEKKRLNADTVYTNHNLSKKSDRNLSQDDLTKHLDYSLSTYTHTTTQAKLQQFKKVF